MTTTMVVHSFCTFCNQPSEVTVPIAGFQAWKAGAYVQDAFPELSAGDREILITGIHDKCFNDAFAGDEDD